MKGFQTFILICVVAFCVILGLTFKTQIADTFKKIGDAINQITQSEQHEQEQENKEETEIVKNLYFTIG